MGNKGFQVHPVLGLPLFKEAPNFGNGLGPSPQCDIDGELWDALSQHGLWRSFKASFDPVILRILSIDQNQM
jgi:hypothetical protein